MDFQGRVIQFIGEKSGTSKTGNPWKKKEWVVETFGQYPRKVKLQCFGDRSDTINLEPGKDYNISIDIESREYNGNWYTDVNVYRVEEINGQVNTFNSSSPQGFQSQQPQAAFGGGAPYPGTGFGVEIQANESDEDLPF